MTSGGAGTWGPQHSQQLLRHGCKLCVACLDNDDAGREHGLDTAFWNGTCGIETKLIAFPVAVHGDVTDWINAGHTIEELLGIARRTPTATDARPAKPPTQKREGGGDPRLNVIFYQVLKVAPDTRGEIMRACPFHVDTLPSMHVDLQRGLFHCFGCGKGGGAVAFYQEWMKLQGRTISREEAYQHLRSTYSKRGRA